MGQILAVTFVASIKPDSETDKQCCLGFIVADQRVMVRLWYRTVLLGTASLLDRFPIECDDDRIVISIETPREA